jgi:transcriptional regulator with XRE-family HTH domain
MTRDEWLAGFATTLKSIRVAAGLAQQELAARIGRHRVTINGWEAGRSTPTVADLHALAMALAVDPRELLPRNAQAGPISPDELTRRLALGAGCP